MSTPSPVPLSPRLRAIAAAVARGDYSVLRDGGEELMFQHAHRLGIAPHSLIDSWAYAGGVPGVRATGGQSTEARKTTVTVVVEDDDDPPPRKPDDDRTDPSDD